MVGGASDEFISGALGEDGEKVEDVGGNEFRGSD